jgi:hypothetical protein
LKVDGTKSEHFSTNDFGMLGGKFDGIQVAGLGVGGMNGVWNAGAAQFETGTDSAGIKTYDDGITTDVGKNVGKGENVEIKVLGTGAMTNDGTDDGIWV